MTGTAVASAGVAATAALLRRMRAEFTHSGRLSSLTVTWMYATYAAHAAATAVALKHRAGLVPIPGSVPALGGVLAVAGTGLMAAGMSRFAGPRQLSAVEAGSLATSGVYRISRNPQYTGYVLQLAGLAVARRSAVAAALTAGMAATLRWWVPVEEAHLGWEFGQAYRKYRSHTHRWLGLPRG